MNVYKVYKKIGETPLEALERFRRQRKLSKAVKLTYIGRLDPMAEGVLLILQDATQAQREKYMGLNKEYEAKVLFGFETDSYDLLGIPKSINQKEVNSNQISDILKKYKGIIKLAVPPYSSVPYKGKPLFESARRGKLKISDIPKRDMVIKRIKLKGIKWVKKEKIWEYIKNNIKKVKGDFRQEKILKVWDYFLCHFKGPRASKGAKLSGSSQSSGMKEKYQLASILISVSSGTYIRSIINDLGKKSGTGAVVFSLKRTKVGKYK